MLAFSKLQCFVLALFSHQLQECHHPDADIGSMSAIVDSANMHLPEVAGIANNSIQKATPIYSSIKYNTPATIQRSFNTDQTNSIFLNSSFNNDASASDFISFSLSADPSFSPVVSSASLYTDSSCFNDSHLQVPPIADRYEDTVEPSVIRPVAIDLRQPNAVEKPEPTCGYHFQNFRNILEGDILLPQLVSSLCSALFEFASQVSGFPLEQHVHAAGQYLVNNVQHGLSSLYALQPVSLVPSTEIVVYAYDPVMECPLSSLYDHGPVCTVEEAMQEVHWPVFDLSRESPLSSLYDTRPFCSLDAHPIETKQSQAVLTRLALPVACLFVEIFVLVYALVCLEQCIRSVDLNIAVVTTERAMIRSLPKVIVNNSEPTIGTLVVSGTANESDSDDYIELDTPEEEVMVVEVPLSGQIALNACMKLNVMVILVVGLERSYQKDMWNATLIGQEISWWFSYGWAGMNEAEDTPEWAGMDEAEHVPEWTDMNGAKYAPEWVDVECGNITEDWFDVETVVCHRTPALVVKEIKTITGGSIVGSRELTIISRAPAPAVDASVAYLRVLFFLLQFAYERRCNRLVTSMFEADSRLSPFVNGYQMVYITRDSVDIATHNVVMLAIEYPTEDVAYEEVLSISVVLGASEPAVCSVGERKTIKIQDSSGDASFSIDPHPEQCDCCSMLDGYVDPWEGFEPTTQISADYLFYEDDEISDSTSGEDQDRESDVFISGISHDQVEHHCDTNPASTTQEQSDEERAQEQKPSIGLDEDHPDAELDATAQGTKDAQRELDPLNPDSFTTDQIDPVPDPIGLSNEPANVILPSLIHDDSGEASDLSLLTECSEPPHPDVKAWFLKPPSRYTYTVWELEYALWHQDQHAARDSLPLEGESYIGLMRCRQAGSEPPSMRFLDHAITTLKTDEEQVEPERNTDRVCSSIGMLDFAITAMRASDENIQAN